MTKRENSFARCVSLVLHSLVYCMCETAAEALPCRIRRTKRVCVSTPRGARRGGSRVVGGSLLALLPQTMLHAVTNQLNRPLPQLRKGAVKVDDALASLLKLTPVRNFVKKWEDEEAPGIFANHAKRYILALRPDSGISFHETDRYKNPRGNKSRKGKKPIAVDTPARRDPATFIEVGVFATRNFKKGEVVNLRGGIADLTEEEDDEMRDSGGRRDFSVLWSERKNCFCLLLGPARFVNHDCRNNVEFQLVGANMTFKVLEDIAKDEEIFTHYGEPARPSGCSGTTTRSFTYTCLQAITTLTRTTRRACARPARSESVLWCRSRMRAG